MSKINFQVRVPNFSEETKKYINDKLNKIIKYSKEIDIINVKVDLENSINDKKPVYKVEVDVIVPNAYIKVQQTGLIINNIIDSLIDPLSKKIKRYSSQKERWVKHKEWKIEQIEELDEIENIKDNTNHDYDNTTFIPKIKRKFYNNDSPIHPAEAIEKMELLGHDSFLFKNIENSKYAMIYRRKSGGYGMVQPEV